MNIVNLTPHALTLVSATGGSTVVPPIGTIARVGSTPGTGPNDGALRNDHGQVAGVTRLVQVA